MGAAFDGFGLHAAPGGAARRGDAASIELWQCLDTIPLRSISAIMGTTFRAKRSASAFRLATALPRVVPAWGCRGQCRDPWPGRPTSGMSSASRWAASEGCPASAGCNMNHPKVGSLASAYMPLSIRQKEGGRLAFYLQIPVDSAEARSLGQGGRMRDIENEIGWS
jgi:hypothetical protein